MTKQSAAFLSIVSNSILVIFKVVAGILMGSVSVISEAIHSGIDLVASVVAWVSIKKANEPADHDHPFGHGKFENISGAFEAILIFFAAVLIIIEAVKKLFEHSVMEKLDWGIGVMAISVIVNIAISKLLFSIARKTNSIALEADAMHLSTDVLTSLGVMIGLVLIRFTHLAWLDPVIAVAVAGMIIKAAVDLTRRSVGDLADQSLPEQEVGRIDGILRRYPQLLGFHKLRTRKNGNQREIDLHIQLDEEMQISSAHDLCDRIESDIKKELPGAYVTIHTEPFKTPA